MAQPEDPKTVRLQAEVTSLPVVTRNESGQATKAVFEAKVRFKGTVKVTMKGDVAASYWSVTPGMTLLLSAREIDDKDYLAVAAETTTTV